MRFRAAALIVSLFVLATLAIAFLFIWRARSREAYGPPVALCPGPDRYGYACEGAAAYAYIDAPTPTGLFADDAVVRLVLPFPFTFYGTVYDELNASSNGNLQFGNDAVAYQSSCLSPAPGMGDLIAPYWADLDLTSRGALETEVVGEAPNRVFVVEWDSVPVFSSDPEDPVTFEAQLFEGSNDIVFLYEDPLPEEGGAGGLAVTGIQSESQGLALMFSCLQPVLPAGGGLRFAHPDEPNPEAAEAVAAVASAPGGDAPLAKGPLGELVAGYEADGPAALDALRLRWFNARPQRAFAWRAADLDGDGGDELIALWLGGPEAPELTQVAALATKKDRLLPLFDYRLSTREAGFASVTFEMVLDLTGDGRDDVLLRDDASGTVWVLSTAPGRLALLVLPEQCRGSVIARDTDGDGRVEIVRDGCATPGRVHVVWDGTAFARQP